MRTAASKAKYSVQVWPFWLKFAHVLRVKAQPVFKNIFGHFEADAFLQ
jgi:hypothetical protein